MDWHDRDWTSLLPDEVLELVLIGVPAHDLVVSGRLVCRRWRRVLAGRSLWRRVRVQVRVGREHEACCVLHAVPALAELALFPEDRVPTQRAALVLSAVRAAAEAGLEVRALSLDWRHFAGDASARTCFHGILVALRAVVRHLDVGLIGVQPVEDGASPQQPRPAPALAALAALSALTSLRVRALFDPCWYFDELRGALHALRSLDAAGCEPYLVRLLRDLLEAQGPTLQGLRLTSRGLAAALAALRDSGKTLHLPALRHLALDLEHQDAVLPLGKAEAEAVCRKLDRLTLARMNRRLPPPGQDFPSETVRSMRSLCEQRPWPALRTLVLEDCLVSPADLTALIEGLGHDFSLSLDHLVFRGGCFLGSEPTLTALASAGPGPRTRLFCRGLRLCPRDSSTGLYPLALQA